MRSRTDGSAIAGRPSSSTDRASSIRSCKSGRRISPTASRSFISVVIATFQPAPGAPSRCASGTRRSVKNTSLKFDAPDIWWIGRTSTPGACMSMKNAVSPACFCTFGSLRVSSRP